jgi:hypothetical protein
MGLKAFIPGTAAYSQKHHVKYLRKKARGHDVLLLVEWEDGTLTEIGADVHPELDGWYKATNGLFFAPAGEGAEPVDYYGVPVIRCHSQIACPFSTEACLAADFDEAGQFEYEGPTDDDGRLTQTSRVVEVDMAAEPDDARGGVASLLNDGGTDSGEAATDGGADVVRSYDMRPPGGAVGHTFSLTQAKQRAPNAISANMLRRAFEYGKEKARQENEFARGLLYGALGVLGVVVTLIVLYIAGTAILGGGGGGGGGGATLDTLALLAGPSAGALQRRLGALRVGFGRDDAGSAEAR